jgi:hypothetical protein
MNKSTVFETGAAGRTIALSVSPKQEDHAALRSIFRDGDWSLCPGSKWALETSNSVDEAVPILRSGRISVVLYERDMQPGTWKDMTIALALMPDPPCLIITSAQADDRLWAEALNLGAYDVLSTPFHATEVIRSLSMAWLRSSYPIRPILKEGSAMTPSVHESSGDKTSANGAIRPVMVYLCECGSKWTKSPEPVWLCKCGRLLIERNNIIYTPARQKVREITWPPAPRSNRCGAETLCGWLPPKAQKPVCLTCKNAGCVGHCRFPKLVTMPMAPKPSSLKRRLGEHGR